MRLLYDRAGAADILSTTERRIDELRRSGALVAIKRDGQPWYRLSDLTDYSATFPIWTAEDEATAEIARSIDDAEAQLQLEQQHRRDEEWKAAIKREEMYPTTHLTRAEAAEWLGKTPQTLLAWAGRDFGPPFFATGAKQYFYPLAELEKWARKHRFARKSQRPLGAYVRNGHRYRHGTGESVGLGDPDPYFRKS